MDQNESEQDYFRELMQSMYRDDYSWKNIESALRVIKMSKDLSSFMNKSVEESLKQFHVAFNTGSILS